MLTKRSQRVYVAAVPAIPGRPYTRACPPPPPPPFGGGSGSGPITPPTQAPAAPSVPCLRTITIVDEGGGTITITVPC